MTKDEFHEEHAAKVAQTARGLAREWPGNDPEDIAQEIWLRVFDRSPGQFAALVDAEPRFIAVIFYRAGSDYCATERYQYTFHSSEYVYTPDEVRSLMTEAFFDPVVWESSPPVKEKDISITAGGICIPLMDIRTAYEALSQDEQVALRARYEFGITPDETEKKRCNRAIDRMTRSINRNIATRDKSHDGPGSRSAISNAAALAASNAA